MIFYFPYLLTLKDEYIFLTIEDIGNINKNKQAMTLITFHLRYNIIGSGINKGINEVYFK